ncbi:GTPase Der [Acetobacteraceae bacterium EV16G]|uniref:GTPase Der n=1 Tax=Sorlinia euscelidii TaxID=3081148 RepID=A0ABU7U4C2_9PROT
MQSGQTPCVVIAGRPNVGKSTLFNRLVGRRQAIVSDMPGVTRDYKEGEARLGGRLIRIVDTAGLEEAAPDTVFGRMRASSETAIGQADLILFCIDARAGVTPADRHFAQFLRRQNRPVLLIANKAEGSAAQTEVYESFALGLGTPLAVSAEHGEGLSHLMREIADRLKGDEKDALDEAGAPVRDTDASDASDDEVEAPINTGPLHLAIVGRPNAGKSTLVNALLGAERMITGPEPGLTRDSISVQFRDQKGEVQLVDTAGMRKKARVEEKLERISVSASLEALKMAEVVVLVIDALLGVHEQDLQIARLIEREGRACVIALNKWDAVADRAATMKAVSDRLEISLAQMKGIPVITFSALTGAGINKLMPAVRQVHDIWNCRVSTGELNRWFEGALERHAPPLVDGRRLKLRYMTQAKARPPTFILFGTRAEQVPEAYRRYLVNGLREAFYLPGVPIRLQTRGTKNPYARDGQ